MTRTSEPFYILVPSAFWKYSTCISSWEKIISSKIYYRRRGPSPFTPEYFSKAFFFLQKCILKSYFSKVYCFIVGSDEFMGKNCTQCSLHWQVQPLPTYITGAIKNVLLAFLGGWQFVCLSNKLQILAFLFSIKLAESIFEVSTKICNIFALMGSGKKAVLNFSENQFVWEEQTSRACGAIEERSNP